MVANSEGECPSSYLSRPRTLHAFPISFLSDLTFLPACHFYPLLESRGLPSVIQLWPLFCFFAIVLNVLHSSSASYYPRNILGEVASLTPLVLLDFHGWWGSHVVVLVIAPLLYFHFVLILHLGALQKISVKTSLEHLFLFLFPFSL